MNMRKIAKNIHISRLFPLAKPARIILAAGLPPIFLCVLGIWAAVAARGSFAAGTARYFAGMLEYPLAALVVITGGALLADAAAKRENEE